VVIKGNTGSSTFAEIKMAFLQLLNQLEYDPNRSSRIALVVYEDGEKDIFLPRMD